MGQTTNRNWKAGFLPSTVSSTDLVASNHQRWTKVWDTSWIASMACHPNTRSKGGSPTGCQKCDMNHTFSWLVQKPAPTNNGLWYNPPTTRWYDVIRNIKQPTGMGFFSSLLTSFIRKSPFFGFAGVPQKHNIFVPRDAETAAVLFVMYPPRRSWVGKSFLFVWV